MNNIVLLGAGFSANWGGYLASEVYDDLIGRVGSDLRLILDRHRTDGFEAAVNELQEEVRRSPSRENKDRLDRMQNAVIAMFDQMDAAFSQVPFDPDPQHRMDHSIERFFTIFDAIFTLNQDTLLEQKCIPDNVALMSNNRWRGGRVIPGMERIRGNDGFLQPHRYRPINSFTFGANAQPLFKLHGSKDWFVDDVARMLVIGGNKVSTIKAFPVLERSLLEFERYLNIPDTCLTVIGYGFADDHINRLIQNAATGGNLRILLVNPAGIDALDEIGRKGGLIGKGTGALYRDVAEHVKLVSKRTLVRTFGGDEVEFTKLMNFYK